MKSKMKHSATKQASQGAWEGSEAESELFMREVVARLQPQHQAIIAPLPQSLFWDIASAIFEQIAATPALKERMAQHAAPIDVVNPERVRARIEAFAEHDSSGTLKRALGNGLTEHLIENLKQGCIAEYQGWETAMQCRVCGLFNASQALTGYDLAAASVDAALRKRIAIHADNWESWHLKGKHGTTITGAVLEYWLPLGLWAMNPEDALRALTLFSIDAQYARYSATEREYLHEQFPERIKHFTAGKLKAPLAKSKEARASFHKAVFDLKLYKLTIPLAKLAVGQIDTPKPLYDYPDGRNRRKLAPDIAKAVSKRKEDPTAWEFVGIDGQPLVGRW